MGIQAIITEADKSGLKLQTIGTGAVPITRWTCKCSKCNSELITSFKAMSDPARVKSGIEQQGWEFHRNQPVCPTCVAKAKEEKKMTTTKIEAANPKLQRKVYGLLDDHFDEDKRLYRSGWSDKKVAEAAETSEQYVASVRRGAYGELAEDPAITAIRGEIDALRTEAHKMSDDLLNRMSQIEDKITKLNNRLDGFAMKKVV